MSENASRSFLIGHLTATNPKCIPVWLECQIIDAREGGYDVMILKGGVRGFLKTSKTCAAGFVLIGEFKYWQDVN